MKDSPTSGEGKLGRSRSLLTGCDDSVRLDSSSCPSEKDATESEFVIVPEGSIVWSLRSESIALV